MPNNDLTMTLIDRPIRKIVADLRESGIDTDWSCCGEENHMVIRPTIEARTWALTPDRWTRELTTIESILQANGIVDYWVSLVWSHGKTDVHGGEPVWLIQFLGRYDFLSMPVGYDKKYLTDDHLIPRESSACPQKGL